MGVVLAVAMVLVTGSAFTTMALVNELALGDRPAISSRFGPTDPEASRRSARATSRQARRRGGAAARRTLDDRRTGQVVIEGIRAGEDMRWTGFVTRLLIGQVGAARWARRPGSGGRDGLDADHAGSRRGRDLDRPLVTGP
jgi:hypothetical protein